MGWGGREGEVQNDPRQQKDAHYSVHGEERSIDGSRVGLCCELVFRDERRGAQARGDVVGEAHVCHYAEGDEGSGGEEVQNFGET